MKRLVLFVLSLGLAITCLASTSSGKYFSKGLVNYDLSTTHSLVIAPDVYCFEYEEPGLMREKGLFYGAHLDYMYLMRPDPEDPKTPFGERVKKFFIGVESRFAAGRVDYESNGTGSIDDVSDYAIEVRGIYGFEWAIFKSMSVSPYFGLGYRYLNDDSGGRQTTTGHLGYERESNYLYLPLGARLSLPIFKKTLIGGAVEFDVFLSGKQRSHLGDVISGYEVVENRQKSGYGGRASVFIRQEFKAVDIFVEPYIRYWDIDDSEITVGSGSIAWIEPENHTIEAGLKLGVRF